MDNPRVCKSCVFWEGDRSTLDAQTKGTCHRHPPQPAGIVQQQGIAGQQFAIMWGISSAVAGYWCGDYSVNTGPVVNSDVIVAR